MPRKAPFCKEACRISLGQELHSPGESHLPGATPPPPSNQRTGGGGSLLEDLKGHGGRGQGAGSPSGPWTMEGRLKETPSILPCAPHHHHGHCSKGVTYIIRLATLQPPLSSTATSRREKCETRRSAFLAARQLGVALRGLNLIHHHHHQVLIS